MIYANILNQDLSKLNFLSEQLLELMHTANDQLIDKENIHNLEKTMKAIDNINLEYNKALSEVKNLVRSTHYQKLSELIIASNNDELYGTYNKTIHLTRQIHQQNQEIRSLLELCQKLTDNHINLIFGKTQKPTNYNFDKNNLNKHMLKQFKNNR